MAAPRRPPSLHVRSARCRCPGGLGAAGTCSHTSHEELLRERPLSAFNGPDLETRLTQDLHVQEDVSPPPYMGDGGESACT